MIFLPLVCPIAVWVTFPATLPIPRTESQEHSFNSGLFHTGAALCPLPHQASCHTGLPASLKEPHGCPNSSHRAVPRPQRNPSPLLPSRHLLSPWRAAQMSPTSLGKFSLHPFPPHSSPCSTSSWSKHTPVTALWCGSHLCPSLESRQTA